MKKSLFVTMIFAICLACGAGSSTKGIAVEDVEEGAPVRFGYTGPNLYGDVEALSVRCYDLSFKTGEEVRVRLTEDSETLDYTFNYNGNVIERDEGWAKACYTYDEKGYAKEMKYLNEFSKLCQREEYVCDENGRFMEVTKYDAFGKLKYVGKRIYDENDNVIEYQTVSPEGKVTTRMLSKYDELGNRVEYSYYRDTTCVYTYKCEFEEDRLIKETGKSGDIFFKHVCDSIGNIVETRYFKGDSETPFRLMVRDIKYRIITPETYRIPKISPAPKAVAVSGK